MKRQSLRFLCLSLALAWLIAPAAMAQDEAIPELSNGVAAAPLSAPKDAWLYYRITIPANVFSLEIMISGGTGDADLYTKQGAKPTKSLYDCRPYKSNNEETCTVKSPAPGVYYVGLNAFKEFTGLTLQASLMVLGDIGVVSNAVPIADLAGKLGQWQFFSFTLPADVSGLVVELTGGTGNADLYTKFGEIPTLSSYDCHSVGAQNEERCDNGLPSEGKTLIGVYGKTAYAGVTLKASYQIAPPGGDPTERTFVITAVNDNLDNQDMYILADGLTQIGYRKLTENTNVTSAQLIGYLQKNITLVYHTGHGNTGAVMTADGSISTTSTVVQAQNSIFATCLTVKDTGWKNQFGTSAQTISGYTEVSYDSIDDDVVRTMATELGKGRGYTAAWYLGNTGISQLADRWLTYVKEGTSIVEYSARSNNKPPLPARGLVALGNSGRLWASEDLLMDSDTSRALPALGYEVNAEGVSTQADPGELRLTEPVSFAAAQAGAFSAEWLRSQGALPEDAVEDVIVPITRKVEKDDPAQIVGYTVLYRRAVDGFAVRGNGISDHLAVLVSARGVQSVSQYWPKLTQAQPIRQDPLLDLPEALEKAADEIVRAVKGDLTLVITQAQTVYGTRGPNTDERAWVPAYELTSSDGSRFVIDARTGTLLD